MVFMSWTGAQVMIVIVTGRVGEAGWGFDVV